MLYNIIERRALGRTHPHLGEDAVSLGDEAADKIAVYRVKVFLFELFRLVWETLIVFSEI